MSIRSILTSAAIAALCTVGASFTAFDALAQSAPAQAPSQARNQSLGKPTVKTQQKTAVALKTKKGSVKPAAKGSTDDPVRLKEELDHFAKDCIMRMNKQRRPGISHKEVKRQPDGTFLARYMAVDIDSLETSFNPTNGNKTIKYIGSMRYHEVEYVSSGKNQKQALAGPFSEANRVPITELIKFKKGKWSY